MYVGIWKQWPVGIVVTTLFPVREVLGSIPALVKSDTESPTARHRCNVFFEVRSYVDQALSCGEELRNSLHVGRNTASIRKV